VSRVEKAVVILVSLAGVAGLVLYLLRWILP